MERDEGLAAQLVVRRSRCGNCTFDEGTKRELIELCLSGTASVAKVGMMYGSNPNLLHKWLSPAHKEGVGKRPASLSVVLDNSQSPFITVVTTPSQMVFSASREFRLSLSLKNGVLAELSGLSRDDVIALLPMLTG